MERADSSIVNVSRNQDLHREVKRMQAKVETYVTKLEDKLKILAKKTEVLASTRTNVFG